MATFNSSTAAIGAAPEKVVQLACAKVRDKSVAHHLETCTSGDRSLSLYFIDATGVQHPTMGL